MFANEKENVKSYRFNVCMISMAVERRKERSCAMMDQSDRHASPFAHFNTLRTQPWISLLVLFIMLIWPLDKVFAAVDDKANATVIANIENNNDYTSINIGWNKQVGAAIFLRAGKLWIVFDEASNISFQGMTEQQLKNGKMKGFKQLNIESTPAATFIIADVAHGINLDEISVIRSENTWLIKAVEMQASTVTQRIDSDDKGIITYISPVAGMAEINFNSKSGKIISYVDPFIGDDMIVVPTVLDYLYMDNVYYYVDFELLKTAQGAAIQKNSDRLQFQDEHGNILIRGIDNPLSLSPKVYSDKGQDIFQKFAQFDTKKSILSLSAYTVPVSAFKYELSKLYNLVHDSKSMNKGVVWVNIALFYLANHWYNEASTAISMAYSYNMALVSNYKAMLLESVAEFMHGNRERAYEIIKNIYMDDVALPDKEEVRFWKGVIASRMNEEGNVEMYFSEMTATNIARLIKLRGANFLTDYTPDILFECGSAALFKLVGQNSSDTKDILNVMMKLNLTSRDDNRLKFYLAQYYVQQEDQGKAIDYFNQCLEDVNDQFNYARCMAEKGKYLKGMKLIPTSDYIDRLERVLWLWRGDEMEIRNLKTLADLYHKVGKYADSLRVWKIISVNYPNNPTAISAVNNMGSIFIEFFTNYDARKITPLKALSFFYEFQNLIPIGNTGDDIVLRAASYMVELYMLDKAAALLEHQVKNRLVGQRREIALNVLARVYVASQKPDAAIKILEEEGDLSKVTSDPIWEQRKYIYARALLHNGNYGKMFKTLKNDYSYKADKLKSKAYWDLASWKNFSDFSEPYLYSIRYGDNAITNSDTTKILKQMIAYAHADDNDLSREMYLDFKDRIPDKYIYTDMIKYIEKLQELPPKYGIDGMQDVQQIKNSIDGIMNTQ